MLCGVYLNRKGLFNFRACRKTNVIMKHSNVTLTNFSFVVNVIISNFVVFILCTKLLNLSFQEQHLIAN